MKGRSEVGLRSDCNIIVTSSSRFPRRHTLGDIIRRALISAKVPCTLEPPGMVTFWMLGVMYYKLLNPSETITGTLYKTQLMRLSRALKEKCPQCCSRHDKIIPLHDNAHSHVAVPVKNYLKTLDWEVLPQPPYSPDIVPSDLRSMAHTLSEQRFTSYEDTKNWVDSWIASKDKKFFGLGI
ncbi:Mariner Mos1 transposase [Eumeta japonica]|uniref:Mariner Mos1 transposase n=1 Tax=Eumeta variegata TaxID=151549 RepID=A0A4C1U728_EUMVA|nr:Mariner Mos1 transposase [Eumeta japonica]